MSAEQIYFQHRNFGDALNRTFVRAFGCRTMLSIVTVNIDSPAETYIRQHIRKISPGCTAVVHFEGEGVGLEDIPLLKVERDHGSGRLYRYVRSASNFLLHRYPGALTGSDGNAVANFFREHEVKAVLAEFGTTGCALLPVCRSLGIRLIVNFHGYDATVMPKRCVIRQAYKQLNKYADGFVCGSNHFAGVLRSIGLNAEKIHVVPCGIELDQFDATLEKDPNLLIAVGRLTRKKAPHHTIRAFADVRDRFPDARLEMIGDGPLMDNCRTLISELDLEQSVILHGARDHTFVKERMGRASVFLQHSVTAENGDTESQGISLLEAMASGVPVVTTDHNGFSETVVHKRTGLLVSEHDVIGMAKAVMRLLENAGLRHSMGLTGRKRVEQEFDADMLAGQMCKLLADT